jgi:hypothetical protein
MKAKNKAKAQIPARVHVPVCDFCPSLPRYTFDSAPMCLSHFRMLYLSLGQEWTD